MTELKNTYYKQLAPGESHLCIKTNNFIPLYFQRPSRFKNIECDDDFKSLPFIDHDFITNMLELKSEKLNLVYEKLKEIINLLPGKYCLICSHFINFEPEYLKPHYYILNCAFISLEQIPDEYRNI